MPLSALIRPEHLNEEQLEVAQIIGFECYRALIYSFVGSGIWIPKATTLVPKEEYTAVIHEMSEKGFTINQIASKLDIPFEDVSGALKPPKKPVKRR